MMCAGAFAADLDIGTHASFYSPPEGGGNTVMDGVDATYRLGPYFSARGDLDNSSYQASNHKYSLTSLAITLIGHLLGDYKVDPYLGGGLGLYDKQIDLRVLPSISKHSTRALKLNMSYRTQDTWKPVFILLEGT